MGVFSAATSFPKFSLPAVISRLMVLKADLTTPWTFRLHIKPALILGTHVNLSEQSMDVKAYAPRAKALKLRCRLPQTSLQLAKKDLLLSDPALEMPKSLAHACQTSPGQRRYM